MRTTPQQAKAKPRPVLYRLVFDAVLVKWLVLAMFAFFVLHPAVPAFAATEAIASEEMTQQEVATINDLPRENPNLNDVALTSEMGSDMSKPEITESTDMGLEQENAIGDQETRDEPQIISDAVTESGPINTAEPDTGSANATTTPSEGPEDETAPTSPDTPVSNVGDSGEPEIDTEDSEVELTSTTTPTQVVYIDRSLTDPNILSFEAQNCVTVGEGSFYCSETTVKDTTTQVDTVFTAQDSDGDTEIFMTLDGETNQLSNNLYDDNAPDYDPKANVVVWQRLVDGQYEVVLFDIDDETETVLTKGDSNDMEPSHEEGVTVWQRWIDGNWEIMLTDGNSVKRLTENSTHDIAPDVRNGFVMWNAAGEDGQRAVSVYEVATGLTSSIADTEGGQVSNPRFVLVYDTELANGDIVTKGFNPETGEVEPLSAMPADVPQEIPPPDPTGETRALIQNKSTTGRESGETESNATSTSSNNTDSNMNQSSSATSTVGTPGASQSSTTEMPVLDLSGITTATLPLSDFDLIVEPFSTTSSSQLADSTTTANPVE